MNETRHKKLTIYGLSLNLIGTVLMISPVFFPQSIGDSFIVSMNRTTGEYIQLGDIKNRYVDAVGLVVLGSGFILQLAAIF